MSINVSELIWTILCFFVLLFVLKKLLIDPLLKVMDARNANVAEGLEAGRQAQLAREENDEALQQAKKDAAQQANVLVQEAKSADEKARQAAVAEGSKAFTAGQMEWKKGEPSYPDANSTCRLTYGTVKSYSPKDGVSAELEQELPALVETLAAALLKEAR